MHTHVLFFLEKQKIGYILHISVQGQESIQVRKTQQTVTPDKVIVRLIWMILWDILLNERLNQPMRCIDCTLCYGLNNANSYLCHEVILSLPTASVFLSVCLPWTDFHEILWMGGPWPKEEPIKTWSRSRIFISLSLTRGTRASALECPLRASLYTMEFFVAFIIVDPNMHQRKRKLFHYL